MRTAGLLRALAFEIYFYLVTTLVCVLGGIPVLLFARRLALPLAHRWIRLVLGGARLLCGIRIVVSGAEHLPRGGAALIACQHQSVLDTLLWFTLVPRPSYVMKRELERIWLFGPLLVASGMVPVDRAAGASAMRQLLADTARLVREGRQIVIFPEGTRVAAGARVPLQPGVAAIAARTGLPVVPVCLDTAERWGPGLMRKRAGTVHVRIGRPIPAGLPRPAMLAAIEAWWHDADPVDKSVGQTVPTLRLTIK